MGNLEMSGGITMSEGWNRYANPAMHARISAAIGLVFDHTDPRAIRTEKAADGSDLRYALYDSEGQAAYGWDLFDGTSSAKASPFRRADYRRTADGQAAGVAADSDGRSVVFFGGLALTAEELVSGLEQFAKGVAGRPASAEREEV
jgi:hypothetical protein